MVGMWEAYKLLFTNYINFSGKSSRAEYWWVKLINFVIEIMLFIFSLIIFIAISKNLVGIITGIVIGYLLVSIYSLVVLVPNIALIVRRYRDTGISPWWLLVTCVVPYFVLILMKLNINNTLLVIILLLLNIINLIIKILPSKN